MSKKIGTRRLVATAMLSTLAFVLMLFEFPLPFLIPSFIRLDFSDMPALLGAFSLGPLAGIFISLLKNLIYILIKGSTSGGVGELINFLLGALFSFLAGYLYQKLKPQSNHPNRKQLGRRAALLGSCIGVLAIGLLSVPINLFVTYPIYASLFGGMDKILAAYQVILPSIDTILQALIVFNLPFTLFKGLLSALICFMIYKPLAPLFQGDR